MRRNDAGTKTARACLVLALGLTSSALAQTPPAVAAAAVGGYIGISKCSSTNCHGYAEPHKEARVNQNEAFLWENKDKHRNAFAALQLPLARQINERLKLGPPANEARCLACHSPLAAEGVKDPQLIARGVSCEVCHGAAESWLGNHLLPGATHESNVAKGMIDLKDPAKRAQMCLSCHLGNEAKGKSVDHELIAAGHPDLWFDLARFYSNMPPHSRSWYADPSEAFRAWGAGQAAQLEEHLNRIAGRAKDKIWPEYAEQRCDACHHSLTPPEESFRQQLGYPGRKAGNIPFNASRFSVYRVLLAHTTGDKALDGEMEKVFEQMSKLDPNRQEVAALAAKTAALAHERIAAVSGIKYDAALAKKLFQGIIAERERIASDGARAALQAAWALHLLIEIGRQSNAIAKSSKVDGVLREIDDHLDMPEVDDPSRFANPSHYNAPKFAEQLKSLGDAAKWN